MTTPPPALTVVIATYDRRPILERTLDALAAQTRRDFLVVVVDDGSGDGTWEWLESRASAAAVPELAVARQENRGQGQARNRGLRLAAGPLTLFLGDDVIPRPDFVAEHLAAHAAAPEPRAVVGFTDWRRREMKVTPALEMAGREGHQFGYGHMTPGGEVPFTCFYTSNVSLPREALGADPFDPAFRRYGWEDVELGYRLSRRGLKLYYHPAAAAEHLHPMTLADLFARQRLVGRGLDELLRLHPELAGRALLAPPSPPRWFGAARRLVPPLVPLLSAVDGLGVPLSTRVLHRVLMCGYYLGREEARAS
ncbi:MAG TPA: glycosyltransferase family 2 protein [Thermoanaerobaculia bacterium]|jgi:GT2 family glycosyltransferase